MSRVVGIDYSMSSPAMCIYEGDEKPQFMDCQIYFLTNLRKCVGLFPNMVGQESPEYTNPEERFDLISDFFVDKLKTSDRVVLEGYSYGSKGMVFEIGENAGVLKHKLWRKKIWYDVVAPSAIKKFATGKGNADKAAMEREFILTQEQDLRKVLGLTAKQSNPASDIIDAYYMCCYAYELDKMDSYE